MQTIETEQRRIAELRSYQILDTMSEPQFDKITQLAARMFHAPIALISLSDSERQWFKSRVGLHVGEIPRGSAFCNQVLQSSETFVLQDATADNTFRIHPYVAGEPRIRFYAGAALKSPKGYCLGTFCILDYKPREFSKEDKEALEVLAEQVMCQLELKRKLVSLSRIQHELFLSKRDLNLHQKSLEEVFSGVALCEYRDNELYICSVNRAFQFITGYKSSEVQGKSCRSVLFNVESDAAKLKAFQEALAEGHPYCSVLLGHRCNGEAFWGELVLSPIKDAGGAISHYICVLDDVTAKLKCS